jgi:hypothetical protein
MDGAQCPLQLWRTAQGDFDGTIAQVMFLLLFVVNIYFLSFSFSYFLSLSFSFFSVCGCPLASLSPPSSMVGSVFVKVWVITSVSRNSPKLEKLTQVESGQFHSSNCYLVLLTYFCKTERNKQKFIGKGILLIFSQSSNFMTKL